jgi:hypothetical protein
VGARSPTSPPGTSAAAGCSDAQKPKAGSRRSTGSSSSGSSTTAPPTAARNRVKRLERRWRNLTLIHLPLHASWLNQIEIAFSIIQRKLLTPNDFDNLADLARTLNEFEHHYNKVAKPFDWRFTRTDLHQLMRRLTSHEPQLDVAA